MRRGTVVEAAKNYADYSNVISVQTWAISFNANFHILIKTNSDLLRKEHDKMTIIFGFKTYCNFLYNVKQHVRIP
jgi:hypothetical protein